MPGKSLPAYLQQVLEEHMSQSDFVMDEELEGIFDRLTKLNNSVENIKATIRQKRIDKASK